MADFNGTAGNDTWTGAAGNDRAWGYGGSDTFNLGAGDDLAWGGDGNDYLYGQDGNDDLSGDTGDDNLSGGLGVDYLRGGTGADYIVGGDGGDFLYAGSGNDILFGEGGNDNLYFGATSGGGTQQGTGGAGIDYFFLTSPGVDASFATIKDFTLGIGERVYLQGLTGAGVGVGASNGSGYWIQYSGADTIIRRDGYASSVGRVEGVNLAAGAFFSFT